VPIHKKVRQMRIAYQDGSTPLRGEIHEFLAQQIRSGVLPPDARLR